MKANYKIAAAVIGSFGLGLGAAGVLHAQRAGCGNLHRTISGVSA